MVLRGGGVLMSEVSLYLPTMRSEPWESCHESTLNPADQTEMSLFTIIASVERGCTARPASLMNSGLTAAIMSGVFPESPAPHRSTTSL